MAAAGQRAAGERNGRGRLMMVAAKSKEDPPVLAERWIRTYDDLDAYVAECDGEDDLWLLVRAMSEDCASSGNGEVDVGEIMVAFQDRIHADKKGVANKI